MDFFLLRLMKGMETNGRVLAKGNSSDFNNIPRDFLMNAFERWVGNIVIFRGLDFIRMRKS